MIRGVLYGALLATGACSFFLPETYGAELRQCIELSRTLEQSEACRCEVNKRYDRPCTPALRGPDAGL